MNTKRWTCLLLVAVVLTLSCFAGFMYWTDPLLQYGTESGFFSYYKYTEDYVNPGIAQHYTYDTVLVGTSMIQNTNVDEFDKLLNCDAVRLPYSGGNTCNMRTILDVCFESSNEIKDVYWELNDFQLRGNAYAPLNPLPTYLYRDDNLEDAAYLLNLDIFTRYSALNIYHTLRGDVQVAERRYDTLPGDFCRESTLASYVRPEQSSEVVEFTKDHKNRVDANLYRNIIPLLEAHPDTMFTFYFVPFSALYWDERVRFGTADLHLDMIEYAMSVLLPYENVEIYFYHNEPDVITNLDNYKDFSHYAPWINSYVTKALANGENRVTADNYAQYIDEMRTWVHTYDFDKLINGD